MVIFLLAHGLSLCIQGTPLANLQEGDIIRFIPVYTGNTYSYSILPSFCSVYPCVYREHTGHEMT